MAEGKKVLVGTIHLPADDESAEGHIYHDGDVPSAAHAALITNKNAWRVESGDPESDLYANASEHMRFLLNKAKGLGIEPGNGLPRNPSEELVSRAIRFAEDEGVNVQTEQEKLDGRTKEGRAAKAGGSVAGS